MEVPTRFVTNMWVNGALPALLRDQRGATAIEYGLIAALIAVAAIVAFQLVGTNLSAVFNSVATDL